MRITKVFVLSVVLVFSMVGCLPKSNQTSTNEQNTNQVSANEQNKSSITLVGTSWYNVYNEGEEEESTETFTFISDEWLKQNFVYTYRNESKEVMWYYKRNQDDPNTGTIYEADKSTVVGTFVVNAYTFTIVLKKGKVCPYYPIVN